MLSYFSNVEIMYQALEFTFSMIYLTISKYQSDVFLRSFTFFLKFCSLNVNGSAKWFNRILRSEFSFYRGTPITANKTVMHSKTATGHMLNFHI